jgi:peptidoglycan/LPS O-acetylase OafA/YrhL
LDQQPGGRSIFLGYGVLGICHLRYFSGFGTFGDFSYGIYIYGFVMQQSVGHFTDTASALLMFVLAFPLSVVAGAISWHLIEKRTLRLKRVVQSADYPLSERHLERARRFEWPSRSEPALQMPAAAGPVGAPTEVGSGGLRNST